MYNIKNTQDGFKNRLTTAIVTLNLNMSLQTYTKSTKYREKKCNDEKFIPIIIDESNKKQ